MGGRDGCVLGRMLPRRGGAASKRKSAKKPKNPDGNQMHFLGPQRIFGTMEVGRGKWDYKKGFLISLKKKKK